nr:helix-turn-helix domain-containing protein [uncultured Pseudomonas sp.]
MSTTGLNSVLARLKEITGTRTDAELSRLLAISPQTLSSWKVRDSIPYSFCIEMAMRYACSLDWLLLGRPQHTGVEPDQVNWESDVLNRLRTLSVADRHAILLLIKDKQRIQALEQLVSDLRPGNH